MKKQTQIHGIKTFVNSFSITVLLILCMFGLFGGKDI